MGIELKIGDEGKTDSGFWPSYKIVAAHSDGRLICELTSANGVPHLCTIKGDKASGTKLLPPTPNVRTLRRWLWMCNDELRIITCDAVAYQSLTRPADITYRTDGRIVSIVFVDEPTPLDLQVGDVVRLRNGVEDRISSTDARTPTCDQPILGATGRTWWKDGRWEMKGRESEFDIVEVVKRAD